MLDPLISLDGEQYRLARKSVLEQAMLGPSARSWSCDRIPVASTRIARPNIRPSGERPNEYLLTLDDWSGGVCNLHDNNSPNAVHVGHGVNVFTPGTVTQVCAEKYNAYPNAMTTPPVAILHHGANILVIGGGYVYRLEGDECLQDYALPAGRATDAIIYHDNLYIACSSDSGQVLIKRTPGGTYSLSGDTLYADFFAIVEDTLWRSLGNNVYALTPGGDPLEADDWGSAISIGSSDCKITDLNGYGEKLAVSKEDGLYLGDSAAIFPNVLPQVMKDSDNGRLTCVVGSRIFYHCANGDLLVYEPGFSEETGLKDSLAVIEKNESDTMLYYPVPSHEITAMCSEGESVWVASEPSYQRQVNPDYVLFYEQSNTTYTDITAKCIDRSREDSDNWADLSGYNNTSDAIYIGYSAKFYGVFLSLLGPVGASSVIEYWDGAQWSTVTRKYDKTSQNLFSPSALAKSGAILFAATNWAATAVDGKNRYWIRLRPTSNTAGTLDYLKINEVRIIKDSQAIIVYRGRKRRPGDNTQKSIVWEPACSFYSYGGAMHAMALFLQPRFVGTTNPTEQYPYDAFGCIVCADMHAAHIRWLVPNILAQGMHASSTGYLVTPKYDCGTPLISKLFTEITLKGRVLDATHTIQVYYRVDNDTAWTSAGTVDDAIESLSLSNVTGYTIQLMFKLNAVTGNFNEYTELNLVQVRFREQPVYKNKYNFLIELCEYQQNAYGGMLPAPDVQLTNLEAEQGGSKTLLDPLGRSKTVTVDSIREVEYLQENLEYPVLLVELVCTEV
jgi:hypothetical protein